MNDPETLGSYRILGRIRDTGLGRIYEARDARVGRKVAIELCTCEDAEIRGLFPKRAQLAAELRHPAIAAVLDIDRQAPFVVRELPRGEALDLLLARRAELPPADRLRLLRQLAEALEHAHRRGMPHLGLRPEHVRLLEDGGILLDGLGTAQLEIAARRRAGTLAELAPYLAPEQLRGVDAPASDLYAFARLAWDLLSRPSELDDTSRRPPRLAAEWSGCPARLAELLTRCLREDPAARPDSAVELLEGFEAGFEPAESFAVSPPSRGAPVEEIPYDSQPPPALDENVQFTVYRPQSVRPLAWVPRSTTTRSSPPTACKRCRGPARSPSCPRSNSTRRGRAFSGSRTCIARSFACAPRRASTG